MSHEAVNRIDELLLLSDTVIFKLKILSYSK